MIKTVKFIVKAAFTGVVITTTFYATGFMAGIAARGFLVGMGG